MSNQSPYEILEIPRTATSKDIKLRYKNLVRAFPPEHHPDKFTEIRAAYDELMSTDMNSKDYFPIYKKPLEFLASSTDDAIAFTSVNKAHLGILFETPYNTSEELKNLLSDK